MKRTLVHELNDLQAAYGYLRREDLEALARRTKRPLYEIQGLLSFYPHYRTEPAPAIDVTVCRDLACHLADGDAQGRALAEAASGRDDVEVNWVSCIGRCDRAPAATVNEAACQTADATAVVARERDANALPPVEASPAPDDGWPTDPYDSPEEQYGLLKRVRAGEFAGDEIVQLLKDSGLRGMGGAGFPTGLKWGLVAAEAEPLKYVVCNADESEPGTFKDREILRQLPHLVLEGMLLAMEVVDAAEGIVFIRHEYGPEEGALALELERARAAGAVTDERDIEIFRSPGGYILGEETALLECLEGKRGEPRNKPPFPGVEGLWGKPTLINNVETFHHIPSIIRHGVEWWRDQGAGEGHDGWKFISVSGDVEHPGVHCIPTGTTVTDLIERCGGVKGGKALGGFAPGGASSNFMRAEDADVELNFQTLQDRGSMLGSGAMVVVAEGSDLLALATNVLGFFANESCGKCVPCRVGSKKAVTIMEGVLADAAARDDDDWQTTIRQLEETLRLTSICGLGQVALGPLLSVMNLNASPASI